MRISYFPNNVGTAGAPILEQFVKSITTCEIVKDSLTADAAIIWSVLWNGRTRNNKEIYYHYRNQNKPVIILEIGALQRNITWRICVNRSDSLGSYWPKNLWQKDRASRILANYAPVSKGQKILICGQNYHSDNWRLGNSIASVEQWIMDTYDTVQKFTDRPIDIRPHPRSQVRLPDSYVSKIVKHNYTQKDDTDFVDILSDYYAVINYNSYPGIQARLRGINAVVDHTSLAAAVSNTSYDQIEKDLAYPNQEWLDFIAHTEFYLDEIESGFAWSVIRQLL